MSIAKNLLVAFLAWVIPFIISFSMYSPDGDLIVDIFLFKSIMLIVGTSTWMMLLVSYFSAIDRCFIMQGILTGLVWMIVSIALDILILIPMANISFIDYFIQIGMRYLIIPIISASIAVILSRKVK